MNKTFGLTYKEALLGSVVGCLSCVGAIYLYFQTNEAACMFVAGMQMNFMLGCVDEFFFQKRIAAASSKEVSGDD